jgi:ribose-phosphate pyrophosphokinase
MPESVIVLGFPEYSAAARRVADARGLPYRSVEVHRFPDGESRVRLPPVLADHVVLVRSLHLPNQKLVELGLAVATARELGAARLTLVAPYLCYMRQDAAFAPGEAVSQRVIGSLLARWFDDVLTVDPHLHRVRELSEVVPARRPLALSAAVPVADFLAANCEHPLLVGPDEESGQWVGRIAGVHGFDHHVGRKRRYGDQQVEIAFPAGVYAGRQVVLVDDVASTGHTLEVAARMLQARRPASISVMVVHALFVGDALVRLDRAGVDRIWSTDSVPHDSNVIALAPLLAEAL